jgi:hypothetical protein
LFLCCFNIFLSYIITLFCILSLKKIVVLDYVELNNFERDFYGKLMARSRKTLSEAEERKKYVTAFTLFTRMRQLCDHPFLVVGIKDAGVTTLREPVADTPRSLLESDPVDAAVSGVWKKSDGSPQNFSRSLSRFKK